VVNINIYLSLPMLKIKYIALKWILLMVTVYQWGVGINSEKKLVLPSVDTLSQLFTTSTGYIYNTTSSISEAQHALD
jgi:hypothetical protein